MPRADILVLCLLALSTSADVSVNTVQEWAENLGYKLMELSESVTGVRELKQHYNRRGLFKFVNKDDITLVQEISDNIQNLTQRRINAVKRIARDAQAAMKKANLEKREFDKSYSYYSTATCESGAKQPAHMKTFHCSPNSHFFGECVNTSLSSVLVPKYVNDRASNVLKAINWTEELDSTFIKNYEQDPSLSWQYFGSSSGIMRHFPGVSWDTNTEDTFDCRLRTWYLEASMNPREIIILVDTSESMSGIKLSLARNVVNHILETLGNNDFVHVMKVGAETSPVVDCFHGLVQATPSNILEMKLAMKSLKPESTSQFETALTQAFDLFQQSYKNGHGALCWNRAIMIISDKLAKSYVEEISGYYEDPSMYVRLFTYQISDEKSKPSAEMKILACTYYGKNHQNGNYQQIKTATEVREKVHQYLQYMEKPLLPVQEGRHLRARRYLRTRRSQFISEVEPIISIVSAYADALTHGSSSAIQKHHLVMTISMPILGKWDNETIVVGVAGIDIPINDIKKVMQPHKVGVNGYTFIVTNNGHLLLHPKLHPEFSGTLKPNYNSMDLTEIEFLDDSLSGSANMIMLRDAMVSHRHGKKSLNIKHHDKDLRRISSVTQLYYYVGIKGTPFSVAVVLPQKYGLYRAAVPDENVRFYTTRDTSPATREFIEFSDHLREFINDTNWTIHPDWVYCKYNFDTAHKFKTPEDELCHFLELRGLRCTQSRHYSFLEHKRKAPHSLKTDSCYCDHDLFMSLMHDAMETRLWTLRSLVSLKKDGVSLAFLSTHSGLTRWLPLQRDQETVEFMKTHIRAIEEDWYKRAVEFKEGFVYAVPFMENRDNGNAQVTASHALFVDPKKHSVPAAVVGYRMRLWDLNNLFSIYTSQCSSEELDCYLLDDNGYIVASEPEVFSDVGKFFGEVEGYTMNRMVEEGIFKRIPVLDFQAVCLREDKETNRASFSVTPMQHLLQLANWIIGMTIWLAAQTSLWLYTLAEAQVHISAWEDLKVNSSKPEQCVTQVDLYKLINNSYPNTQFIRWVNCDGENSRSFAVQQVPHSNLVLVVVVDALCNPPNAMIEFGITHNEVEDSRTMACLKSLNGNLTRRPPRACVGASHLEGVNNDCSGGNEQLQLNIWLFYVSWSISVLKGLL